MLGMRWASGSHLGRVGVDALSIMGNKVTLNAVNGAHPQARPSVGVGPGLPTPGAPAAAPAGAPGLQPHTSVGMAGMAGLDLDRDYPGLGSITSVRQEIDDAFEDAKHFHTSEPDEVMKMVSGHSSRLSELRVRIMRVEDFHRAWKQVRVREIEPCLEELTSQYQIASRLHSVRELDWKMSGGQP